MDNTYEVPGLDLSILNKAAATTTELPIPETNGAGIFPVGSNTPIPVENEDTNGTGAKPDKKPLPTQEVVKPVIEVRDNESQEEQTDNQEVTSPVKAIADFLKEKGIVDYTDEEFKDNDDFIPEIVDKSIKKGVESYKESLDPEIKRLIELKEEGVPLAQYLEHERSEFEYSNVDKEKLGDNTELQKTLVFNYLIEQGWDQAEIDDKIKDLEDTGLLKKEADRSLTKLVTIEQSKKQALIDTAKNNKTKAEQTYKEQIQKLDTTLKDTKEFIPGLATNDAEKKLVFEAITKFDKTGMNKITKDLQNPANYIKLAYIANVLGWDFTKVAKSAKTSAINEIKKTVDAQPAPSKFKGVDVGILKKIAGK